MSKRQTPDTRRYFTPEEQGRALGDVYQMFLRDADAQGNTEGDTMDNPTQEKSDLKRRLDAMTPAEWRRVAAVIDFILAQPRAGDPAQGEPTE